MRVVSGSARGTKLDVVPGTGTRPIQDRAKTALFDILRPAIAGQEVLDLFAGSGSIGIEALSQGAQHCVFLDTSAAAIETIKSNLKKCGFENSATVRHKDAFLFLRKASQQFDCIFIAPPQYKGIWSEAVTLLAEYPQTLRPNGRLIVQIDPQEYERLVLHGFIETDSRTYGNTMFIFYTRAANHLVKPS
jgi:16S rRNA (guanine(966)-N(2))-methyltransferase RsmD